MSKPPSFQPVTNNPMPPPWQVKWKRPRLDTVQLGFEPDDDDDGDGDHDDAAASECEELINDLKDDWVPVSCSSVVLTRDEARRALMELYRRDRLLVKRRRKQTKAASADTTQGETSQKTSGATTPTKLTQKNADELEENTPRNSNVKKSIAISPSALLSPSSWFKKSSGESSSSQKQRQDQSKSPKSKTATDSESISKPPRLQRNKSRSDRHLLSPPSSSLFTTFSNLSSRHIEQTYTDEDRPPSPPIMTDASTASSLLWEDNTLISVSEEDAVAFRMYESSKMRSDHDAAAPDEPLATNASAGKHNIDENDHYEDHGFGCGRYYCDRHGNLRARDFDGFDNVVLSVTIYATTSSCKSHQQETDATFPVRQPTSGEVIVMELLSTKNPPNLDSSSALQPGKQRKLSSSSSSQTNPPPPPSKESDSSTVSSTSNSQHQLQMNEEEEDASSSHTRIIARRVLRWPSSIVSLNSKSANHPTMFEGKLYSNVRGCPSLVSLGRTNMCEERRVTQTQFTKRRSSSDDLKKEEQKRSSSMTIQEYRADDALEAIRCLNFLFGESDMNSVKSSSKRDKSDVNVISTNDRPVTKQKITQPLRLCFITNDGQVLFFHAMRVFLSRTTNRPDRNVSNSFAAFLFGNELLNKVYGDVVPLSHPDATIKLSQVASGRELFDDCDWNTVVSRESSSEGNAHSVTECEEQEQLNVWARLTDFDASIDPSSLKYRTFHDSNVITCTCTTSNTDNAFLVVCGKGLHRASSQGNNHERYKLGGFVTFISLRHCNEAKTIYVPFAIESIQPVFWNRSHYVVLLGEKATVKSMSAKRGESVNVCNRRPFAVAIRVDSIKQTQDARVFPRRFQPICISLPSISELLGPLSRNFFPGDHTMPATPDAILHQAISVSAIPSSPPGIVLAVYSTLIETPSLAIINCSLGPFQNGALSTVISPGQRLCLDSAFSDSNSCLCQDIWCTGGQGWSLLGSKKRRDTIYYISWEGTNDTGPCLLELSDMNSTSTDCSIMHPQISTVMPIMSFIANAESTSQNLTLPGYQSLTATLPFTSAYSMSSFLSADQEKKYPCSSGLHDSILSTARTEGGIDDALVSALGSISVKDRSKALAMTHEQKSKRILQHCSSWTQLDDTRSNRGLVHGQVLSIIIRFGSQICTLSLRTNVVTNPLTTPFNQVLSWLCQRRDYATAAGVALSLLNDTEAVYELRGISEENSQDSITHQGLLDGITHLSNKDNPDKLKTLTSLADMTVGCLIKGGASMAATLEGFLSRNTLYDSARASLMLVGTIALVVSSDEPTQHFRFNDDHANFMERLATVDSPSENILWPMRCLLKMAVARNCLSSALLLLNSTIPNELRWRQAQSRGLATSPRPSLGLFLAVVEIILESCNDATRIFLDLFDEESGNTYWFSVENDTRLVLCLFSVHGKHVLIQQPEVRAWILDRLKEAIQSLDRKYNDCYLPDEWLCEIVTGVFCNAECDICLGLDAKRNSAEQDDSESYRQDMLSIQNLLVPHDESGGLDFDILIPSLLILSARGKDWREGTSISTQVLLNVICDLAGRKTPCDPRFLFDGRTVMRQCALADNVQAAAFLIGGRSGLVLECADLLISNFGLSMKDAEIALFGGSLADLKKMIATSSWKKRTDIVSDSSAEWAPSKSHYHILWLIRHHVLSVSTYGDIDMPTSQTKLSPVTAGRICFRAWLCLTEKSDIATATKWLEIWLKHHLNLKDGLSTKRLACAVLVRILLWPDEECSALDLNDDADEDELILASVIGFDIKFLAELSHSCVGLIQSIPPQMQSEIMSGLDDGGRNRSSMFSFELDDNRDILRAVGSAES